MTALTVGDRVSVLAPSYPGSTGIVTDPSNGNTELTVTVLVGARPYVTAHETYFAPDELELIPDGTEPRTNEPDSIGDDRHAIGASLDGAADAS